MRVGFTGARQDTTPEQHHALCEWLKAHPGTAEWHHGACVGADAESVEAVNTFRGSCRVVAHPPANPAMVSNLALMDSNEVLPTLPYLERNRAIVDATELLLACPKGPEEVRSGTWSTIRYARKLGRPVVIFWPDGSTEGWNQPRGVGAEDPGRAG